MFNKLITSRDNVKQRSCCLSERREILLFTADTKAAGHEPLDVDFKRKTARLARGYNGTTSSGSDFPPVVLFTLAVLVILG